MASGARGGGAEHLLGILGPLTQAGIDCAVAVGDDGPLRSRVEELGVACTPLNIMGQRLSLRGLAQVGGLIEASGADVVHAHGTRGALATVLSGLGRQAPPVVYTIHGLSYRKPWPAPLLWPFIAAEALICRRARQVISVSQADIDDLRRRRLLGPRRGEHLANAVAVDRFAGVDPTRRGRLRRSLGIPEDALVFGTVSRLVPQKAVDDLLAAFARCAADSHLVVAGDGPLRREIEDQAEALGVANRCHLLGSRDDIPAVLAALDIFVLSSHWEGEPIALLEALAAGLAVVATATSGSRAILTGAEAGGALVLAPIGDIPALAQAMSAVAANPGFAAQARVAGRRLVGARGYAGLCRRLMRIYRDVVR